MALSKGALQLRLESANQATNELQLQLSAERAAARNERARSTQVQQAAREAVRRAQEQLRQAQVLAAEREAAVEAAAKAMQDAHEAYIALHIQPQAAAGGADPNKQRRENMLALIRHYAPTSHFGSIIRIA